ncbi:MAG: response regulator [Myxococcales bacterium]|nr:response regulator [Myxococcales bacterium]
MRSAHTRHRILIVEDDEGIADSLLGALEDRYDVALARNGREGLEALSLYCPDLVLLDLMLPVLDGAGFLAARTAVQRGVPVIIMSAGWDAGRVAREHGVPHVLVKPFGLEELDRLLERLLTPSGGRGGTGSGTPRHGEAKGGGGTRGGEARRWRHLTLGRAPGVRGVPLRAGTLRWEWNDANGGRQLVAGWAVRARSWGPPPPPRPPRGAGQAPEPNRPSDAASRGSRARRKRSSRGRFG